MRSDTSTESVTRHKVRAKRKSKVERDASTKRTSIIVGSDEDDDENGIF